MRWLAESLADDMAALAAQLQRSLVVLHNGRVGVGAGILLNREGWVITNHHVATAGRHGSRGRGLRVELFDGCVLPARLVAHEAEIDLAVLRVAEEDMAAQGNAWTEAVVADSHQLRIGELVMALGHPWGQRGMVTLGLVSGIFSARTQGPRGQVEIIRSDARLAPGNSGGPLVNARGEVVGLNTMIIGGNQGMAISSRVISDFLRQAGVPVTA